MCDILLTDRDQVPSSRRSDESEAPSPGDFVHKTGREMARGPFVERTYKSIRHCSLRKIAGAAYPYLSFGR